MKFIITFALLAFASTAFSAPVENLNDAIENLNQLAAEQNVNIAVFESPDQESLDLQEEFKDSIPKLEKIQRGLRRDGLESVAKLLNYSISFAKKCADDPQFIQDNKPQVIRVAEANRKLFKVAKKYLDDEDLFVSVN